MPQPPLFSFGNSLKVSQELRFESEFNLKRSNRYFTSLEITNQN